MKITVVAAILAFVGISFGSDIAEKIQFDFSKYESINAEKVFYGARDLSMTVGNIQKLFQTKILAVTGKLYDQLKSFGSDGESVAEDFMGVVRDDLKNISAQVESIIDGLDNINDTLNLLIVGPLQQQIDKLKANVMGPSTYSCWVVNAPKLQSLFDAAWTNIQNSVNAALDGVKDSLQGVIVDATSDASDVENLIAANCASNSCHSVFVSFIKLKRIHFA